MNRLLTLLIFFLFGVQTSFAQQTSILFLGNSYTATQNLPLKLYNLALAGGDTIYFESNTPGGYTLEGHSTNATSLNKINSRNWDFVALQEQSQRPSFPDAQVAAQVFPYAANLVDSIKSNYECTEPVFFMTWGRRDGDQQNCANFPPLCTFEGMQERLRNAYLEMTFDNDATVAPCGAAWQQMALVNNTFWSGLYSNDGSHPSPWGTYLNACVFYATIFRKSPVGIEYYANVGQTDAEVLQQLAEDIVLDSLSNWNIGHADPIAEADVSYNGTSFEFTHTSTNAEEHEWFFGDGNTSTEENPTHIYNTSDVFEVTYVASSFCSSDTTYLSVDVGNFLSIDDADVFASIHVQQNGSEVWIMNERSEGFEIQVADVSGRILSNGRISGNTSIQIEQKLKSGMNLVTIFSDKARKTYKVVLR